MLSYRGVATHPPTALVNADLAVARHGALGRRWLDAMWDGDPLADAVVADGASRLLRARARRRRRRSRTTRRTRCARCSPPSTRRAGLAGPRRLRPRRRPPHAPDPRVRPRPRRRLAAGRRDQPRRRQAAGLHRPLRDQRRGPVARGRRLVDTGYDARRPPAHRARLRAHRPRPDDPRADPRPPRPPTRSWDAAAWGMPIPQPFMAFTLAEFCSVALKAMHKLGVRFTHARARRHPAPLALRRPPRRRRSGPHTDHDGRLRRDRRPLHADQPRPGRRGPPLRRRADRLPGRPRPPGSSRRAPPAATPRTSSTATSARSSATPPPTRSQIPDTRFKHLPRVDRPAAHRRLRDPRPPRPRRQGPPHRPRPPPTAPPS